LKKEKNEMSANNDPIASALGLTPMVPSLPPTVEIASIDVDTDNKNDIEVARQNLHNLVIKGNDALDEIILIAKQAESARAFEVVSTLIKTLTDANRDLVDLAKKKKDLLQKDDGQKSQTINNNLIVSSTSDLIDLLKNKKE
jgi:hypothetical protein